MIEFLSGNWEYLMVVFYVLEKVVKLTPWKQDDIILDVFVSGLMKLVKTKR